MISEKKFENILKTKKFLEDNSAIVLPNKGGKIKRYIRSLSGKDGFILNIERGKIKLSKVKYQTRSKITNDILLRVDTNGPRHQNPDGEFINCPHIHIYKEGYGDKWAYKLDNNIFKDDSNLAQLLRDFLNYFNIESIPNIIYSESLI